MSHFLVNSVYLLTISCKITGWIDQGLNEKAYIIPGLGDFGERRCVFTLIFHWPCLTIYLRSDIALNGDLYVNFDGL